MFNFDFETYKLISWKKFVIYAVMAILLGWMLLTFFPMLFGWLASVVLGPLASFFASHDTCYHITQAILLTGYTIAAVAGIDFIFLFLFYTLFNQIVPPQTARAGTPGFSLRALWALLKWQFLAGVLLCIVLCWREGFSVVWLIPPFLTENVASSIYMMGWELSLLIFAFGFAFADSCTSALENGKKILLHYMPLWMVVVALGVLFTYLPAMIVAKSTPSWVLLLWGLFQHVLLFMLILIFLFNQPNPLKKAAQPPQPSI